MIANDLSAIQPSNVPPNLTFEIDDVESPWPYSKPFDFIHTRALAGAVTDWPKLYSQAFEHLTPGGYFEATDCKYLFHFPEFMTLSKANFRLPLVRMKPYSEDGREDFIMREMSDYFAEALKVIGKPADVAHLHKQGMVDAGFINVKERVEVVPYSAWPADKKARLLGMYHMHSIIDAIHSYGLAPLVRILGMPRTEAEVLLATARAEVMNPNMRLYSLL